MTDYSAVLDEINKEGYYRLSDTHFRVGGNLHSNTYYNFKRFFEFSYHAAAVAHLLCDAIKKVPGLNIDNTTLITYGTYSNLFLTETVALLQQSQPALNINYAIANDRSNQKLSFQNEPEILSSILIIVPSANSGARSKRIIEKLKDWLVSIGRSEVKIHTHIFAVFSLKNKIFPTPELGTFTVHSLKELDNDVYQEHACELCYYELNRADQINTDNVSNEIYDPLRERPFFPIKTDTESPGLIFGLPNFYTAPVENNGDEDETLKVYHTLDISDVFQRNSALLPNIYGHLDMEGSKFSHYIRTDIFYEQNKSSILRFLGNRLAEQIIKARQKRDGADITELIFITTNRGRSSRFLDDFVKLSQFDCYRIRIINFEPANESPDNFYQFYGQELQLNKKSSLVIFYSDVIFNGSAIKDLNTFLKKEVEDDGFDLILTLVDRTTDVTKKRIFRRLYKPVRGATQEEISEYHDNFIAFFKLNVPVLSSSQTGNPIFERHLTLQKALGNCHIDALKLKIIREIYKCEPARNLKEMLKKQGATPGYFPFFDEGAPLEINQRRFEIYKPKYLKSQIGLLKLFIYHELSNEFSRLRTRPIDLGQQRSAGFRPVNRVRQIISNISGKIQSIFFGDINPADSFEEAEKRVIEDEIVKSLSRSPFADYKEINDAMFAYSIQRLHEILDSISGKMAMSFSQFRELKFFIRRTVELNSNAIISQKFVSFLKEVFYDDKLWHSFRPIDVDVSGNLTDFEQQRYNNYEDFRAHRIEFKYFLCYCYKELLQRSPARGVMIEHLLNKDINVPWNNADGSLKYNNLEDLLRDRFYGFGRILKTENINILHNYKEEFLAQLISDAGEFRRGTGVKEDPSNEVQINAIFRYADALISAEAGPKDSASLQLLKNFISQSRYSGDSARHEAIKRSITWMLAASAFTHKLNLKQHGQFKENLEARISSILKTVLNIFTSPHPDYPQAASMVKEHSKVGYVFLIQYQKNDSQRKVFAFSSGNSIRNETTVLNSKGLASLMLDGVFDEYKGNIQTLLPVLKTGVKEGGQQGVTTFSKLYRSFNDETEIDLDEAFAVDSKLYQQAFQSANMFQYFRLSEIEYRALDDKKGETETLGYKGDGKAVLIICNNSELNPTNFLDFLNVEKMRLLLLIKEELVRYIKKLVENDAFIENLNSLLELDYQSSLKHGIGGYLGALCDHVRPEKKGIANIISAAILGQISARSGLKESIESNRVPVDKVEFQSDMESLFRDKWYGCYPDVYISGIEHLPDKLDKILHRVIIPELIINMKKNHPKHRRHERLMRVEIVKDQIIFSNRMLPLAKLPVTSISDAKSLGGLEMCSVILKRLGYGSDEQDPIEVTVDKDKCIFTTILNLKSHD